MSTGKLVWCDLTVPNATQVKDFYQDVVGFKVQAVSMGEYDDYSLQLPDTGEDVAGVCHAKGPNSDLPAQWMMYFMVDDLDASLDQAIQHGGKQRTPVKSYGPSSRYAIVEDPAGAVCALFEDKSEG